jgi:CheY-like chemotaxis protein
MRSVKNEIIATKILTMERILFIDDDVQIVELGERMLGAKGYQVDALTSSKAALDSFRANAYDYDMVITDQTMPEFTGFELARSMLRIRPDIPIILMTGYSEIITSDMAKQSGIQGYLTKPFDLFELIQTIQETTGRF